MPKIWHISLARERMAVVQVPDDIHVADLPWIQRYLAAQAEVLRDEALSKRQADPASPALAEEAPPGATYHARLVLAYFAGRAREQRTADTLTALVQRVTQVYALPPTEAQALLAEVQALAAQRGLLPAAE
jgi:hypothetical protein